jgi:hypothetical protein
MFEVLRDEAYMAWLNAIAMEELVEIETAEVAGVTATIAGADAIIVAPVMNCDWKVDPSKYPVEDTTFAPIFT